MLKKISIILLSVFFGGALVFFAWKDGEYFPVLGFLFLFNLLFVWPLAKRFRFLAVPLFLSIGSLNLLYLIDGLYERVTFIILASIVYGLALWGANRLKKYDCDQTAQGMVNLATIVTIFFWLTANYGWYLNFDINSWLLIITIIASVFLIVLPSLTISFTSCYKIYCRQDLSLQNNKQKDGQDKRKKFILALRQQAKIQRVALFFSLIIAFVLGEVMWGLSFWPFGYLTTGMTAVIIFFLFWSIIRRFIMGKLTKQFVIINMIIMVSVIIIMIITSPWDIV